MVLSTPVCFGTFPTSVRRPFFNAGAESFTRPEASGFVPVVVHGCSVLRSMLHSGEEDGLGSNLYNFRKVLSTNTRDLCVFFLFLDVLCNKFVPPLLFY
jgi:hypothetical protein